MATFAITSTAGMAGGASTGMIEKQALAAAVAHLARGEAEAALRAASEACHEAPRQPQAHYVYGQAWLALNEPARAEQAFAAAIQLAPDWADAWINYGIARYRQGAIEDAKTAMRQVLAFAPDHAAAAANLGAFLRITGQSEAAEALLRRTLAHQPSNAAARLNLAADLLQEERAEEALALLDQAAPPDDLPQRRHWLLQKSLALLQLGQHGRARCVLDALGELGPIPPAFAPLWHWRKLLLASGEGDPVGACAAAEAMEASLETMGPEAVLEHEIMAHYDLAKFWSGRGAHARAFGFWVGAHKLLAQSQPFSRAAHSAFINANIATFTRDRFLSGPRAQNNDPAPIFIVGMLRSGTTLCEQILAAHRDVHGAGERAALGDIMCGVGGQTPSAVARLGALDPATLDAAAAAYLAELHALAPDKSRIVDKMPDNYMNLALVGLMLPGARIIHCTRDPRDIGLSIFTFHFHGIHPYAHDLGDLGWTITQQIRLMSHWKRALPNLILTVALSDWVEDFDGTLARVLLHVGLPPDPACARFYEQESRVRTAGRTQVRQPVNARGLGRWRSYAGDLAPLISELEASGLWSDDPSRRSWNKAGLSILPVEDPARAMGLAVEYLMTKPAFQQLPFGAWAQVLAGQIERGHFRFIAKPSGQICGFFGWALTNEAAAEGWVTERRDLRSDECKGGDHMIFNAWSAETTGIHRFMVDTGRAIIENNKVRMLYFKRYYPDGRIRPIRLPATDFMRSHVDRAAARLAATPPEGAS